MKFFQFFIFYNFLMRSEGRFLLINSVGMRKMYPIARYSSRNEWYLYFSRVHSQKEIACMTVMYIATSYIDSWRYMYDSIRMLWTASQLGVNGWQVIHCKFVVAVSEMHASLEWWLSFYYEGHSQGFFLNFWWGGDSKFSVPISPRRGRSPMGGGTCKKKIWLKPKLPT